MLRVRGEDNETDLLAGRWGGGEVGWVGLEAEEGFDFGCGGGHGGGEDFGAVWGEGDGFFEAEAEACGGEEDAWFDGEGGSGGEGFGVGDGVVDFHADVVEDAMGADAADGRGDEGWVGDVGGWEEAAAEEFVLEEEEGFVLAVLEETAWFEGGDGCGEGAVDGFVGGELERGEGAGGWEGAGEVGVPAVVFGGGVEEDEVALFSGAAVAVPVEGERFWA